MERLKRTALRLDFMAPVLALAAIVVVTFPTLVLTANRWTKLDESYSHGFLLLAVSLVLCVLTARRVRPRSGFYPFWLLPFLLALAAYAVGDLLMVQALRQLVLVPLFMLALMVLWGWRQMLPFLIPTGVLFFAMPVWDYMDWPLQLLTTAVNQFLLGFANIEFEVEGVFIYLIGVGAFEIAGGCSGLRYLLVANVLAALYAKLNYRTWRSFFILLPVGILVALLANWVRVFIIIYMGYVTEMETGLIEDHDAFGWWVFAATLVPLFFFARWLEGRPYENQPVNAGAHAGVTEGGAVAAKGAGLGAVAILSLATALFLLPDQVETREGTRSYSLTPLPSDQWSPLFQRELEGWSPQIRQADWEYRNAFFRTADLTPGERPDQTALVSLFTYNPQRGGREVVQYGNRLYDGSNWLQEARFDVDAGDGVILRGVTLRLRQSDKRLHVAYGYYVEGRWETDQVRAKLAQLYGALNPRNDGSLLAVGVHCRDCEGREAVSELARKLRPELQEVLDERFGP